MLLSLFSALFVLVAAQQVPFAVLDPHEETRALTGKFLHITDLHPDIFYRANAHLNNMCHVEPEDWSQVDAERSFQSSKAKKDHKEARAGYWAPPPGTECDASIELVNATFDYLRRDWTHGKNAVDFVIWTGDSARHDNDNRYPRTLKQILTSNEFLAQQMQNVFGSDVHDPNYVPVVPTFGNNDVYPHNTMFPGPNSKSITAFKEIWKTWIPVEQLHSFERGGYFHMPVAHELSVISLNSLYFYSDNKAVDGCSSKSEAGSLQLEWLELQLRMFRLERRKVWIIGHIPPTERQWFDGCFYRYADLVIEYRDLIIGQLFGHINIDHFYFLKYQSSSSHKTIGGSKQSADRFSKADLHTAANPIDVLKGARDTFDFLPHLPRNDEWHAQTARHVENSVGNLAVINVAPSLVPNYFPTLRIYDYLVDDADSDWSLLPADLSKKVEQNTREKKKKKSKGRKHHKKPSLPPVDRLGPGYALQRYTPLKYVQYYLNTTEANANAPGNRSIEFEVEYDTSAWPYYMPDLTVSSWVRLGNEISGLKGYGGLPNMKAGEDDLYLHSPRHNKDVITMSTNTAHCDHRSRHKESAETQKKTKKDKKHKKKKKKQHKRNDGFWTIFKFRGFVSTNLEAEYDFTE